MELVEAADLLGIQMDDLQVCERSYTSIDVKTSIYVVKLFVGESFSPFCPFKLLLFG